MVKINTNVSSTPEKDCFTGIISIQGAMGLPEVESAGLGSTAPKPHRILISVE